MPNYKTITLGCKVNQSESDEIADHLEASGWIRTREDEPADLCILNTCAVTAKASQQSRQAVRRAIRFNPNARIVVTGCYAQVEPNAFRKIPGVHEIVNHSDKLKIPDRLLSGIKGGAAPDQTSETTLYPFLQTKPDNRSRPFLKIQDGCDAFCTYCIVPYARGRSRSMAMETVMKNINRLKRAGYQEVVLSGIHLGCYGMDFRPGRARLIDLLKRIDVSRSIDRVRLSSIEPLELSEDIMRLIAASEHICHHFHIPLQSGDDQILERMHRPYTGRKFRDLVSKIHELMPDAAIGVDTLIGFPGETETAFQNTYALINDLPVSYLHVFPFSPRKGTPAARYPEQVPKSIIKSRCRQMHRLGMKKKTLFFKKFLGKTMHIIVENKRDPASGHLKGVTSNYIPVIAAGPEELKNRMVKVILDRLNGHHSVFGTIQKVI